MPKESKRGMECSEVPLELLLAKTYKHGWTALHYAAHNGNASCHVLANI